MGEERGTQAVVFKTGSCWGPGRGDSSCWTRMLSFTSSLVQAEWTATVEVSALRPDGNIQLWKVIHFSQGSIPGLLEERHGGWLEVPGSKPRWFTTGDWDATLWLWVQLVGGTLGINIAVPLFSHEPVKGDSRTPHPTPCRSFP